MRKLEGVLCFVCLVACAGVAQVKTSTQWKCAKAADSHSIDVGDKPGHAYVVDQINCTAAKGEIDGVKQKSGLGTEFLEVNGDKVSGHGEFVETLANGDKNFYTYQLKGNIKNGVMQAGSDTWSLREGNGKLKGAKASGTCQGSGSADQSATWDCSGNYTLAK